MTTIQRYLSYNLRMQRNECGLTQAGLAEKVGTSGNYIAQIERGEKYPSPGMIDRIARALDIDPSRLFAQGGEPALMQENAPDANYEPLPGE
ncbi:MAG TPA: helix-turn-helix transcriptional regulator [Treponemataceae bacterium]|nr:helix-turn-helix transcriptional regulator [Treponemataceae bacterium]